MNTYLISIQIFRLDWDCHFWIYDMGIIIAGSGASLAFNYYLLIAYSHIHINKTKSFVSSFVRFEKWIHLLVNLFCVYFIIIVIIFSTLAFRFNNMRGHKRVETKTNDKSKSNKKKNKKQRKEKRSDLNG